VRIITGEECQQYLGQAFYDRWDNGHWHRFATRFVTDPDPGRLNSLAREVSGALSGNDGSVLLVEQTGIFQSSEDMYLAETFRKAFGELRPINEAPAHIFAPADSRTFWSLMHICLLNFWDFLVVSGDRHVCIHGSHDEFLDVFAADEVSLTTIRNLILWLKLKEVQISAAKQ
jgi:hypothetical protein